MRVVVRSFLVVLLALVGAVLLALTSTMASMFTLATTELIMGGTGHPLSIPPDTQGFITDYITSANNNYIVPSGSCTANCTSTAVYTPEQFRFDTGLTDMTFDQSVAVGQANLDNCIHGNACTVTSGPPYTTTGSQNLSDSGYVVFGYSQSATIATLEKQQLMTQYPGGISGKTVSFVLIGNPNRPNGGFLARGPQGLTIPIIGVTFSGPTPTNSGTTPATSAYPTVDIAQQYDGWADGPENPLNVLADANAIAGIYYLHGNYGSVSLTDPGVVNQGTYGDTQYYLIPTAILPLLMPLESIPIVGTPLADTLDPPLRVLVEAGYNRTISPGQPTPWNLLYFPNPIALAVNFVVAIPTGLNNGLQDITGIRLPGFPRPGPFGVDVLSLSPLSPTTPTLPTSTIPSLFGSPAGLVALVDPTTLMSDLATFTQLTSVLNNGLPLSISSPLSTGLAPLNPTTVVTGLGAAAGQSFDVVSKGAPVNNSATTPTQLVSTNTADAGSATPPEPKEHFDTTVASTPKLETTTPDPGTVTNPSVTTESSPSIPLVTKPSQPLVRLPIGATPSGPNNTAPVGNGPVRTVLSALMGAPKAKSDTASGSGSSH